MEYCLITKEMKWIESDLVEILILWKGVEV
jgi:hypothetical protein